MKRSTEQRWHLWSSSDGYFMSTRKQNSVAIHMRQACSPSQMLSDLISAIFFGEVHANPPRGQFDSVFLFHTHAGVVSF